MAEIKSQDILNPPETTPPNKIKKELSVTFGPDQVCGGLKDASERISCNKKKVTVSKYSILSIFFNWQDFAYSAHGFLFTFGVTILAVATFIVLCEFDMSFIGGMVLAGAVFGDIFLGIAAANLQKYSLFSSCGKADASVIQQNPSAPKQSSSGKLE